MDPVNHIACIMLGSNIEPERNIRRAVALLQQKLTVLRTSSVYESASVECCYPDYLNLALQVETKLDASDLKQQLLRPMEARMGRVRSEDKNAARTMDLDIILFDGVVLDPTLWQHAHLAIPVSELFPDHLSETGEPLKVIAKRLAQMTPIQLRKDITIPSLSRD
ncbi:MAG TPA: 2-amino-4-hydroxy-6-hydroxymethyldihydropteridine diphosphokinase [Anaerolineales bacterium]|nr:2-amino-4-hydroxy-6-hydroxymethyldihydropteridine diphosphokinase [Anaerolineales bacterium]